MKRFGYTLTTLTRHMPNTYSAELLINKCITFYPTRKHTHTYTYTQNTVLHLV